MNNYMNRRAGFSGKLSKKFEPSVNPIALVVNG